MADIPKTQALTGHHSKFISKDTARETKNPVWWRGEVFPTSSRTDQIQFYIEGTSMRDFLPPGLKNHLDKFCASLVGRAERAD